MTETEMKTLIDMFDERMDKKFDEKFGAMDKKFDAKFETMDKKFDAKFETMEKKFDEKFEAMDKKFDDKFEAMGKKFDDKLTPIHDQLDKLRLETKTINANIENRIDPLLNLLSKYVDENARILFEMKSKTDYDHIRLDVLNAFVSNKLA